MVRLIAASICVLGLAAPLAIADPLSSRDEVSSEVSRDRARAREAREVVRTDARLVDIEVQRVAELRWLWDREVAGGHPNPAGHYAQLHFEALGAKMRAQDALREARAYLEAVRERLHSDEFGQRAS